MKLPSILAVLTLLTAASGLAQAPKPDLKFHIYLCFGQSNMEAGARPEEQDKGPVDPRFQMLAAVDNPRLNRTMGHWYAADPPLNRPENNLGPVDFFGRTMVAQLPPEYRVGVINVSVAGAKIELWQKDVYTNYLSSAASWMKNICKQYDGNPYQRLVDMARIAQKDGVIRGILLHQGESNPNDQEWCHKVKGIYDNLVRDLNLKPEDVPLLAGELVGVEEKGKCAGFNTAVLANLPKVLPNAHIISSQGCKGSGDGLHFSLAGFRELGKRYAFQMLRIQGLEPKEPAVRQPAEAAQAAADQPARSPAPSLARPTPGEIAPGPDGFIRRWVILEPIGANGLTDGLVQAAINKEYFPDQLTLVPRDGDQITVGGQPLTWHAVDTKNYNVNLYHFAHALGRPTSNVLFWGVTLVHCPEEMTAVRLAIGSNAASVWWVNGQEVIGIYGDRQCVIDDGVSKRLTLRKGPNVIRCAIVNGGGATDFCARFLDPEDKPLTGFTVSIHGAAQATSVATQAPTTHGVTESLDWPQFRGPTGDGISTSTQVPLTWSPTQNVKWKSAVPGRGRSSPVLLGERIWLTTATETNVRTFAAGPDRMQQAERVVIGVVCLDRATGTQLYYSELFPVDNPPAVNLLNSYATPTPVAESGRLYCDFGTFGTACLDSESGATLWKRQLPLNHHQGPGSSPALYRNLLILVRDGTDQQYVTALDKQTGDTVWKTERPPLRTPVPAFRKSFSTPLVFEAAGRTQMVVPGAQWFVSYEPDTGKEIWRVDNGKGETVAPRPVYGDGLVFLSTGVLSGKAQLWAVRVDGQGDVTSTHVAWKLPSSIGFMASPLLLGRELYLLSDDGFVTCVAAETGAILGKARIGGNYAASPVYAEGRIYCFSREGRTVVLQADRELAILSENSLDGTVFASPAFGPAAIYLRTDSHLYCLSTDPT